MRIVVKVGTSTLAYPTGRLNIRHAEELVKVLSDLKNEGHEVILVSSGAIGMGVGKLSLPARPKDTTTKQACAAVGQCELMYTYDRLFSAYDHTVAQILLTGVDVEHTERRVNIQNTLTRLLELGALPIINENDSVATDEITSIGDNDTLAAINDGNRSDNGYSDSRWSTWDKKDDSTHEDAVITMDWATAIATNQINLFYFYQPNDHAQSKLPTTVKFEYTLNSGYENGEIVSNGWQEITPAGEPEEINAPSLHKWTKGYTYKFAETINPIAIRITFSYTGFIGLNEAEVMTPTTTYRTNTSAELSGIKIGNTNLTLGSDDRYEIDESSFDGLSFTNPENASVTVIPVSNREIKIVSVAEDGKSRRTYSVVLKNVPLIPEETETPDTKETETPNTKPETPSTDKPQTPSTPALKKGDTFKVKNIQYKVLNVSKKTVAVVKGTDRKPGKVTKVTIPNTVKDAAGKTTFTVTQIQANAFKNYKNLKSVIIGKNVTSIGKNSFYGCQKLAKVTFKGTSVKTIKSKAFKKTASKVTVSVPKSIRNNKKKAAAFQKKLTKSGMSKKLKLK